MDTLDSTSLNSSSSTVNLGSDLGPLGNAASPSTQASCWDQAMAGAGLDGGGGTDNMGWGGAGSGVPALTVQAPAAGGGPAAPGNSVADAAGHAGTAPGTASADTDKSFWQKAGDFLTDPHTVLGAASFAPSVFGSAASAADGLLYGLQGKYTDAGLSLGAAAVGMVSDAGAARLAAEGIKAGAEALTAGRAGEAVVHAVEAERVGQATGTVAHAAEGIADAEKAAQAMSEAGHTPQPINGATRTVPLGFEHETQFLNAAQELQDALKAGGITDARIGVRGSSVTGQSVTKGTAFSPKSDIDFFIESAQFSLKVTARLNATRIRAM